MKTVEIKGHLPHAAEQCIKLHGVNIHLDEFRKRIVSGQARIASRSNRPDRNFYFVEIEGKTYRVLFCESAKICVTVVPLEFRGKANMREQARTKKRFFRDLEDDNQEA